MAAQGDLGGASAGGGGAASAARSPPPCSPCSGWEGDEAAALLVGMRGSRGEGGGSCDAWLSWAVACVCRALDLPHMMATGVKERRKRRRRIPAFRRRLDECFRLNGPPPPSRLLHSRPIVGRQIGNCQVFSIRSAVGKRAGGLTRRMHVPGMYHVSKKKTDCSTAGDLL